MGWVWQKCGNEDWMLLVFLSFVLGLWQIGPISDIHYEANGGRFSKLTPESKRFFQMDIAQESNNRIDLSDASDQIIYIIRD